MNLDNHALFWRKENGEIGLIYKLIEPVMVGLQFKAL